MKKISNFLWGILAVAMIVVAAFWFMGDGLEHIEDTNGPDNYTLQTITDENIVKKDVGALNFKKRSGLLNNGITFSSDKFTGVAEIMLTNFVLPSDFEVEVAGFYVNGGNFKMAVVHDEEIAAVIEPDLFASCCLENITGTVSLVIAGESADFEFTLDRMFCERYGITIEKS